MEPRGDRGGRRGALRAWSGRAAWLLAGALAAVGTVYVLRARALPDLEAWHRVRLEQELGEARAGEVRDLEDLLALEERLFAELAGRHRELAGAPPYSRFRAESPTRSANHPHDWNRTRWLAPAGAPRGAALLLHGLSDSPYSLRAVGEALAAEGFAVLALRLPGHGTLPAALTRTGVDAWRDAVRVAAAAVAERAGDRPWAIVGYSNGAALALDHALAALQGRGAPPAALPDRLVFLSPAFAVTPLAGLARWQERAARLPGLEKLGWTDLLPEYDPYKYNSFPLHAAAEIHRLTAEVEAALARLARAGRLGELPPALALQSVVDATVPPAASLEARLRPALRQRQRARALRREPPRRGARLPLRPGRGAARRGAPDRLASLRGDAGDQRRGRRARSRPAPGRPTPPRRRSSRSASPGRPGSTRSPTSRSRSRRTIRSTAPARGTAPSRSAASSPAASAARWPCPSTCSCACATTRSTPISSGGCCASSSPPAGAPMPPQEVGRAPVNLAAVPA
ncbi:MAG: alpha/beta hydrolase [Thermoanaerobaculia bacterium]|nr:alpha/beta hydrolase [Thermoanaerobaculia bacterium]